MKPPPAGNKNNSQPCCQRKTVTLSSSQRNSATADPVAMVTGRTQKVHFNRSIAMDKCSEYFLIITLFFRIEDLFKIHQPFPPDTDHFDGRSILFIGIGIGIDGDGVISRLAIDRQK